MDKHAVSADRVVNIDEDLVPPPAGASDRVGPPRRQTSSDTGQHEGGHDIHGRLQLGPWPAGHADRASGQDRRRLAGGGALTTSRRRTAGPSRRPRSCSS